MLSSIFAIWHDRSGSAAIVATLAVAALVGGAGLGVDLYRAMQVKQALQDAADASALAGASRIGLTDGERRHKARTTFQSLARDLPVSVDPEIEIAKNVLSVSLSVTSATQFMRYVGKETIQVSVLAQALVPKMPQIEVAFVLDQTAGMHHAVAGLVRSFRNHGDADRAKLALVPFGADKAHCASRQQRVRDDAAEPNALHLNLADDAETAAHGRCRQGPRFQPLTVDHQQLLDQLTMMTLAGERSLQHGLFAGWHILSPEAPYTQGALFTDGQTRKVVVLMVSGTLVFDGPATWDDKKALAVCDLLKSKGVAVETIALGVRDRAARNLLETCASGVLAVHEAADEKALEEVIRRIEERLVGPARLIRRRNFAQYILSRDAWKFLS